MSGFSAQWLSLREPIDHAARSDEVLRAVRRYYAGTKDLVITDIGTGTGSTIRALKPLLSQHISWHLLDNDDALLSYAKNSLEQDAMRFELVDLSVSVNTVFSQSPDLITTSAFLDLVSKNWLQRLVTEITQRQIPFYAALTYDGRSGCVPEHDMDTYALECFNHHQRGDKGFGPALGPEAADVALQAFETAGYEVFSGRSDWKATEEHFEFQRALIEGWHEAVCEFAPESRKQFDEWLTFRKRLIDQGKHTVFVGHLDIFAIPKVH